MCDKCIESTNDSAGKEIKNRSKNKLVCKDPVTLA